MHSETNEPYESKEEVKTPEDAVCRWIERIESSGKTEEDWRKKTIKIIEQYDEEKEQEDGAFNMLWSNTEILAASLYSNLPSPDVRARQKAFGRITNPQFAQSARQKDEVAKGAASLIEDSLRFFMDYGDFESAADAAVFDTLLGGRAVTRLTYTPTLEEITPPPAMVQQEDGTTMEVPQPAYERMTWADLGYEVVQFDDFRRAPAKRWEDVNWIAFRHMYSKDEFKKQYPAFKEFEKLSFNISTEGERGKENRVKEDKQTCSRIEIWEVWDKEERKVFHVCPTHKDAFILELEDPLQLKGFYPIPKPLYAVMKTHSLVPTPLYSYYERQAEELDLVSRRISRVITAIRVRGIYDKTMTEVSRLLDAGENEMIAAENTAAAMEGGGLERAIWIMPIDKMAAVVAVLYQQRDQIKQVIYEITGLSDILRGASNPNETLGAQQLKAQTGSVRMKKLQGRVQKYFRDILRIQAEIIAEHVPAHILSEITRREVTPEMEALLREDLARVFAIDIETDSTVAGDEQRDIENMSQMFQGMSQYIAAVAPAVESGNIPSDTAFKILKDVLRKFKFGKEVIDSLDDAEQAKEGQQGQQQPENQVEMQKMQVEMQLEQQKMQMEMQLEQMKLQQQMQIEQMKIESEDRRFMAKLAQDKEISTMQTQANYAGKENDSIRRRNFDVVHKAPRRDGGGNKTSQS